ncbi:MAG: heavy-metal-associated domain-containing protein [Oscillospiraceae bacterium]
MKKVMEIGGMSCEHCKARVEKALDALPGVKAKVNLKKNEAVIETADASDESLRAAVEEAGYEVKSIREKTGLFS